MPDSLLALTDRIHACELCPRLRAHCQRIAQTRKRAFATHEYWGRPVAGFGDPSARLLIVGLAPGAHGSNRTGRPFTGDASGDWLYEALYRYGWASQPVSRSRGDELVLTGCFITAAARCAPPDNRPTREELERCRPYLQAELRLLPDICAVLVLGRIGWQSWLKAAGWWERLGVRDRPRFAHGEETLLPDGMTLVSSFHPSRQNTNTGRLTRPMWYGVFERLRTIVARARPQPASRFDPLKSPLTGLPAH
ncbi:MAG TPA: uracil-DNA glycosylase [Gemmatimonadales bacterium]|nr:uracil-DNA glycosylase [Gemmatimonadales bacterium]